MSPSAENKALLKILTNIKRSWEHELAQEGDLLDKTRIFKLPKENIDNVQMLSQEDESESLDKTIILNVENAPRSVKSEDHSEVKAREGHEFFNDSQDELLTDNETFDDKSLNETVIIKPEELDKLSRRQN